MIPAKDVRMGRIDTSRLTRAQDVATGPATDRRGVEAGGQVIEVWHEQPESAAAVLLRQVLDVEGPDAVLSFDPIRNGSKRVVGTRYTVTMDAAEAIRASMAAYQDTLGD